MVYNIKYNVIIIKIVYNNVHKKYNNILILQ